MGGQPRWMQIRDQRIATSPSSQGDSGCRHTLSTSHQISSSSPRGTTSGGLPSSNRFGAFDTYLDGMRTRTQTAEVRIYLCEKPTAAFERAVAGQHLSTSPREQIGSVFWPRNAYNERSAETPRRDGKDTGVTSWGGRLKGRPQSAKPTLEGIRGEGGGKLQVRRHVEKGTEVGGDTERDDDEDDKDDGDGLTLGAMDAAGAQKGMFHRLMHIYEKDEHLARRTAEAFWLGTNTRAHRKPYFPSQDTARKEREQQRFKEMAASAAQRRKLHQMQVEEALEKLPVREALRYHLPDQARLVLKDQSWEAARWGLWKSAVDAKRLKEKEEAMRKLNELLKMEGEVAGEMKEEARKAIVNGDLKGAMLLMSQAQAAYGSGEASVGWGMATPGDQAKAKAKAAIEEREAFKFQKDFVLPRTKSMDEGTSFLPWADAEEEVEMIQERLQAMVEVELDGRQRQKLEGEREKVEQEGKRLERVAALQSMGATRGPQLPQSINLTSKRLAEIPSSCWAAGNRLLRLNLRQNDITLMPSTLCAKCLGLEMLDIAFNKLHALPSIIGNLVALRTLNIAGNRLVCLPSSLGRCSALQFLNAADNLLAKLPPTLARLEHLEHLSLAGNSLTAPPQELASEGAERVLGILKVTLERAELARTKLWQLLDERGVTLVGLAHDVVEEVLARGKAQQGGQSLQVVDLGGGGFQITAVGGDDDDEGRVVGSLGEHRFSRADFDDVVRWKMRIKLTREEVSALWEFVDQVGDGKVSLSEFLYHLKKPTFTDQV